MPAGRKQLSREELDALPAWEREAQLPYTSPWKAMLKAWRGRKLTADSASPCVASLLRRSSRFGCEGWKQGLLLCEAALRCEARVAEQGALAKEPTSGTAAKAANASRARAAGTSARDISRSLARSDSTPESAGSQAAARRPASPSTSFRRSTSLRSRP